MGEQINSDERKTKSTRRKPGAGSAVPAGTQDEAGSVSDPRLGRRYRPHAAKTRRRAIKVLVDDDEWAALNDAAAGAAGLSVSGWLGLVASDAAAERPLISGQQYGSVRELVSAMRRVGVNLNQIAAKLNSGGEVEGLELVATLEALGRVLGKSSVLLDEMTEAMRSGRPGSADRGPGRGSGR